MNARPPLPDLPCIDSHLASLLYASGLRPLQLGGRRLLPIVQGGMGVGVSAHKLATIILDGIAWKDGYNGLVRGTAAFTPTRGGSSS